MKQKCKVCNKNSRAIKQLKALWVLVTGWIMGVACIIGGAILMSINFNMYNHLFGILIIVGGVFIITSYSIDYNDMMKNIEKKK